MSSVWSLPMNKKNGFGCTFIQSLLKYDFWVNLTKVICWTVKPKMQKVALLQLFSFSSFIIIYYLLLDIFYNSNLMHKNITQHFTSWLDVLTQGHPIRYAAYKWHCDRKSALCNINRIMAQTCSKLT